MHDVLGHRISLVSVYAGALEYRAASVGPERASSAAIIRESAHQALQESSARWTTVAGCSQRWPSTGRTWF
jgi:Histidine kinase